MKQEFQDNSIEKILLSSDNNRIQGTIISCLQKYECCIVFDGFNSPNHALYEILLAFNKNLIRSKTIITTYFKFETTNFFNPIYPIVLKGLDKDSFGKLLQENKVFIDDNFITEVFRLLAGHPYLLKLIISVLQYQSIESFLTQ